MSQMNLMVKATASAVLGLSVVLLGACSTTSPDVIKPGDAQRLSQVADAVVLSVRPVVVEGSQSGGGGATGAVLGGVAGVGASSNSRSGALIGVVGAVAGRAVVQAKGNEVFNPGDAVILVTTGGKTRVMLAPKITHPVAR